MYTVHIAHAGYSMITATELFWDHNWQFSKYRVRYLLIASAFSALQMIILDIHRSNTIMESFFN